MTAISLDDPLLWDALPKLALNIAQTAALCGISVRQLGYWTRQGYIDASGQGARRTYRLAAIRRVLAIRKEMEAGASLRQSLRRVAGEKAVLSKSGAEAPFAHAPLPAIAAEASALQRSLIMFFAANRYTRDHAGGLAVKLGLAEEDVFSAADSLCASGLLSRHVCQGMTVFRSTAWEKLSGEAHA